DRKRIAKEIAKTSDSIRKKYRALKTGKIEEDIALERPFKPIIEPLKQIVENTVESSKDPIKNETFFSEEDEEPKLKRKRPSASHDNSIRACTPVKSMLSRSKTVPSTLNEMSEIGQEKLQISYGPLGQKYLKAVLSGKKAVNIDVVYGVYFSNEGTMLGDKHIALDKNDNWKQFAHNGNYRWIDMLKKVDIERLVQLITPSSLVIQDFVIELVKICDVGTVKLSLCDKCLYMKSTMLFMFELEQCIEHVYFDLYQNTYK
ncbi:hypothetical protein ALC60_08543, partial [Trachymyrmex zeteki]